MRNAFDLIAISSMVAGPMAWLFLGDWRYALAGLGGWIIAVTVANKFPRHDGADDGR